MPFRANNILPLALVLLALTLASCNSGDAVEGVAAADSLSGSLTSVVLDSTGVDLLADSTRDATQASGVPAGATASEIQDLAAASTPDQVIASTPAQASAPDQAPTSTTGQARLPLPALLDSLGLSSFESLRAAEVSRGLVPVEPEAPPEPVAAAQGAASITGPASGTSGNSRQPGALSTDSLAQAVAAIVLAELRGQVRDTLIVRIDTTRSLAGTDTTGAARVDRIQEGVRNVGSRIMLAIFFVFAVYYLLRGLLWLLEAVAERSPTRRLFFKRMIPVVRMFTWALVIYVILNNIFAVDRNGLLAASAALGVGIGLAAQDLIRNLLGGIIIIFDSPFQVGDKVSVGATYGEVKSIGLRSTRIQTLDDNLVSVPNSQVVDGQVANSNAGVLDAQVVTKLYLPGWTDVAKAKRIAYEAAANSQFVFLDKPIVVLVKDDFRETFLTEIVVKAYVLDHLYESKLASEITETAKMGFLKAGLLYPVYGMQPPEEILEAMKGGSA